MIGTPEIAEMEEAKAEAQVTAKLYDWWVEEFDGVKIVLGRILEDRKGRFPDGTHIHTSHVDRIEGDLVHTRNSVYRLIGGNPLGAHVGKETR